MPDSVSDEVLLEGLSGAAREERAELLTWLRAEGVPDAVLQRATHNGTILLAAAGLPLGTVPLYSARDISERTGLSLEFLSTLGRANGLPIDADSDQVLYGESYLGVVQQVATVLGIGLTEEQVLDIGRVLSLGLSQASELMRQTVLELAIAPGLTEVELARSYAGAAHGLLPTVEPLLHDLLRLHLHNAVRDEVVTRAEREQGALPGARDVAVAFADLVGFTRLGEQLEPDALEQVAAQLVDFAGEVIEPPVRFVKSVGDAVLLTAPDPLALLDAAFDLVERVEQEGSGYPQLRVGLAYGPAVSRAGDWFGRPVNLASRLTGIARAGSVVCDPEFRAAMGDVDGIRWSTIGDRRVKGVSGSLRLYRARRPSGTDRR